MAEAVLGIMLASNEDDNIPFHPPSPAKEIHIPEGASLVLITVDTDDFGDVEED